MFKYNLQKNKILICVFTILLCLPSLLLAYKPPRSSYCENYQKKLSGYFFDEVFELNLEGIVAAPGEEFEKLYNKELLEKKLVKEPLKYPTDDCSYGIAIIGGKSKLYCKYHGDANNVKVFSNMSVKSYFMGRQEYGILIFMGSGFLSIIIIIIKSIIYAFISKKAE